MTPEIPRHTSHEAQMVHFKRSLRAARARIKAGEGYIYVAELVGHDAIKVGFSLDPAKRLSSVRILGIEPRLMGSFPATLLQEKAFHRAMRAKALPKEAYGSEWYPRSALRQAA